MMPLERRNEPQMLRSFWKQYPSYRVQPLLYKRYNELLEARSLNEWLENRRIRKEGEEHTDAVGRLTDTVNRRLPQLRYCRGHLQAGPFCPLVWLPKVVLQCGGQIPEDAVREPCAQPL